MYKVFARSLLVRARQEIYRKRDPGERQYQVPDTITGRVPGIRLGAAKTLQFRGGETDTGIESSATSQHIHHTCFRHAGE